MDFQPYLIESRWRVYNLRRGKTYFSFTAKGFGKGEMSWYVPKNVLYLIKLEDGKSILKVTSKDNIIQFTINKNAVTGLKITIEKE